MAEVESAVISQVEIAGVLGRESMPAAPRKKRTHLRVLVSKPAQTILLVFAFAATPLLVSRLGELLALKGQSYRQMLPDLHELVSFKAKKAAPGIPGSSQTNEEEVVAAKPENIATACADLLIDDTANALDHFYAALARTDAKTPGAITRVTHYGDSPITNDGITGTVRQLLQERFGDAGHGFILIDQPWAWYGHQAITFTSGGGWASDSLMNPMTKDGAFGLGGVNFRSNGPGKYARYGPANVGDTGKNFSRMDVYYLQQPGGGQFTVSSNGEATQTVSTNGDAAKSGFYEFKAPQAGANTFEVRSGAGSLRLFGVVLENDEPGVVYDSLGVNGAYAGLLVSVMNAQHWAEQLQHRKPDLLILNYGTNESQYASDNQMARYEKDLTEAVQRVREALPEVSILILSPMDRGKHGPGGKITTLEAIPKIVEMQHRVARTTGCAFFNLFAAMGGEGTMARWHDGKRHLVGGDLTHPTVEGGITVGSLVYMALMDGYAKYRERTDVRDRAVATKK